MTHIVHDVSSRVHARCVGQKYTVIKNIGKGAFGEVYEAMVMCGCYAGKRVAIKIEKKTAPIPRLYFEYNIYQKLMRTDKNTKSKNICGIPKIFELIQTDDYNVLVMELLGKSLEDLFNDMNKKFSICTVLYLAISIIEILKHIHRRGIIHRDIKPNNFLIDNVSEEKIYLTDFGLSKKYIDNNGEHIKETFNHSMIGTARYSSINMHLGFEPSRRDDLESVGYMLIYFAKGRLPWQGTYGNKRDMFERIGNIKLSTNLETLCAGLPSCFSSYLKYCRELKFDERPNYEYLIKLFSRAIKDNNYNHTYEWTRT